MFRSYFKYLFLLIFLPLPALAQWSSQTAKATYVQARIDELIKSVEGGNKSDCKRLYETAKEALALADDIKSDGDSFSDIVNDCFNWGDNRNSDYWQSVCEFAIEAASLMKLSISLFHSATNAFACYSSNCT